MSEIQAAEHSSFGVLTSPSTLTLKRTLPGPIERVWAHITDSELRSQWLAAGVLNPQPGASFELVWRNDALSAAPSERPAGFAEESRAMCRVTSFSSFVRNQSTSLLTSARLSESSGNKRRLRFSAPRVSSIYSAITDAPETGTSPSANNTGSVPAGLSARNSLRRAQLFSSMSSTSMSYSLSMSRA